MSLIKNEDILEVAVEAALAASNIIMEAAQNPFIKRLKKVIRFSNSYRP